MKNVSAWKLSCSDHVILTNGTIFEAADFFHFVAMFFYDWCIIPHHKLHLRKILLKIFNELPKLEKLGNIRPKFTN